MKKEKDVKDAVKKILDKYAPHVWWFMPVPTGFGIQGVPDFICCVAGGILTIETKFATNGLTPWQIKQMDAIKAAGGVHFVITERNIDMVETHIEAVLALEGRYAGTT